MCFISTHAHAIAHARITQEKQHQHAAIFFMKRRSRRGVEPPTGTCRRPSQLRRRIYATVSAAVCAALSPLGALLLPPLQLLGALPEPLRSPVLLLLPPLRRPLPPARLSPHLRGTQSRIGWSERARWRGKGKREGLIRQSQALQRAMSLRPSGYCTPSKAARR